DAFDMLLESGVVIMGYGLNRLMREPFPVTPRAKIVLGIVRVVGFKDLFSAAVEAFQLFPDEIVDTTSGLKPRSAAHDWQIEAAWAILQGKEPPPFELPE